MQDLLPQSLEAALLLPSTLKTSKKERLLPSNKRQMRQKWMFVYFPWGRKHLPQGCWSDLEGSEEVKKHSALCNHISCSHTQLCVTEFKTWKVPKWSVTTFLRQLSYSELLYLSENTWLFYVLCTLQRWDKHCRGYANHWKTLYYIIIWAWLWWFLQCSHCPSISIKRMNISF